MSINIENPKVLTDEELVESIDAMVLSFGRPSQNQSTVLLNRFKNLINQPQDLWAECVAMIGKEINVFEITFSKDLGYTLVNYDGVIVGYSKTLEELHAKLTELTKG